MKPQIVFVLYDSITNSIFDSQIAQPLVQQQIKNSSLPITLISFENCAREKLERISSNYPTLNFIFLKKKIFIHKTLLYPLIKNLYTILSSFPSFSLIARGPIAGYLCLQAVPKTLCFEFIIQARGLLAEEYRFTHSATKNIIAKGVHYFRAHQFEKLEKSVYNKQSSYAVPTTIESVSPALQTYLIENFQTDYMMISCAHLDIPTAISREKIIEWRKLVRTELHISEDSHVFCYNGSLKPWQCPQETISFFKEQCIKNPASYLLILTQDKQAFEKLIKESSINPNRYTVITVPHKDIYRYLACCDSGIVFREKNSINWTSRPTKILEYQAVGLSIIHNNTIAFLQKNC